MHTFSSIQNMVLKLNSKLQPLLYWNQFGFHFQSRQLPKNGGKIVNLVKHDRDTVLLKMAAIDHLGFYRKLYLTPEWAPYRRCLTQNQIWRRINIFLNVQDMVPELDSKWRQLLSWIHFQLQLGSLDWLGDAPLQLCTNLVQIMQDLAKT